MWVADGWKDYEVLDATDGERLERWGQYVLVRPDPQVLWHTGPHHPDWKRVNGHYHRSSKGGGSWEFHGLPEEWTITYRLGEATASPLVFHLKPFAFKHTGVFPEQAANWEWCSERIAAAGRPVRVLNLFAYTGGATVAAAAAGAQVTHVDAAKGMIAWAKENAASSQLPQTSVRWIVDDCLKFVEREIRRGKRYDAILMDPPSYGRGPGGEVWKIEDGIHHLIQRTAMLLSDDPLFFLINSYTTGLQPGVLDYLLRVSLDHRLGGQIHSGELGLPLSGTDLTLPCGACCRWEPDQ